MKAVCWEGANKVDVENVKDPRIVSGRDAIVKVTLCAICGSDLHLYDGYIPTMKHGDVLGHEFMGEIVDLGPECRGLQKGDRVVIPFAIACGSCRYCLKGETSACDNTNPNASMAEKMYGFSGAGLYGYSHLYGGYAGGQAQYVRVPFADYNAFKIPESVSDEKALFLGDILPTGWMAAENASISPGAAVAIWGAGPVGLFAALAAKKLGAARVFSIDRFPERLEMAAGRCGAETVNYEDEKDLIQKLKDLTGGRGPDACIDAVGLEAHGTGPAAAYDRVKQATRMESDRPTALRQAIHACGKGGTVSIPGVYGGMVDKFPIGIAFAKGLTFKMGQTHVHRYVKPLLARIEAGEIDPSFLITHRARLEDAPEMYKTFKNKKDRCVKVVLMPNS